jgi:hypothetical protein
MSEEFFSLTPVAGVPELQPVYVCPPPTPCTCTPLAPFNLSSHILESADMFLSCHGVCTHAHTTVGQRTWVF